MRIDGNTELIAHIGWPTYSFQAPLIYNPYFVHAGIPAVVVPFGCQPNNFPNVFRALFTLENIRGALITMPYKVSVLEFLDDVTPTVKVAGACNAVKRLSDGRLFGDLFDGEGFVRGILRKGLVLQGKSALVVGTGGVGSAIVASLAGCGIGALGLYDLDPVKASQLADRIGAHFPKVQVSTGTNDPAGFDIVINASPLGMKEGDPMPVDVRRLESHMFVGEVVMAQDMTAFLIAAQARGCKVQMGKDMLFEQVPAYLDFFGLPSTTSEVLRSLAFT